MDTKPFKAILIAAGVFLTLAGCASRREPLPVREPAPAEEPAFSAEEALAEADAYLKVGRVGEAASLYEQVLEHDPDSFEANLGMGIALMTMEEANFQNQRDYTRIRHHFETASEARPEDPRPYVYLGTISHDEKDYAAAIRHLSTAARLDAGNAEVHELLGLSLAETDRTGEAKTELKKALGIDPSLAEANLELGKIYEKAGSNAEARPYLEKALLENPNLYLAAYYLERVYYEAKLYDLAENECRRFLEVYPDDIQSLEILGYIYRIENRGNEVLDVYTRLARLKPDHTQYWSPVIQSLTEAGDSEAARSVLEEALKYNPYYAFANLHYGMILMNDADESARAGDRKQALELYTRAQEQFEKATDDDRYSVTGIQLLMQVDRKKDALSGSP